MASPTAPDATGELKRKRQERDEPADVQAADARYAAEELEGSVAQSVRTIKAYLDQLRQFLPATGVCYADIGRQHFDDFLVMLDRGEDCIRRVYAPEYAPEHVPKRSKCAAPVDQDPALDDVLKVAVAEVMSEP